MALLQVGLSTCGICGRTIDSAQETVLFAAFVVNAADPVYRFSDGVFHRCCIEADVSGRRCLGLWEQFLASRGPSGRPCDACERPIVDFRDHLGFGVLSSIPDSPLFFLNFVQLHRSHVAEWDRIGGVVELLRDSYRDGELSGPEAERLVQDLESLGW